VRAEWAPALLQRDPERAGHLFQQPRVVNVVLVVCNDARSTANRVAAPAIVLAWFVVELAPFRRATGAAVRTARCGFVLFDGQDRMVFEKALREVRFDAVLAKMRLAIWAPVGGVGSIGFIVTSVALWSWSWPSTGRHAGEHHPVGRERGGSAAKRMAAFRNRAAGSITLGCAAGAHVVKAPEPLHHAHKKTQPPDSHTHMPKMPK
jgi:hypothetical protein